MNVTYKITEVNKTSDVDIEDFMDSFEAGDEGDKMSDPRSRVSDYYTPSHIFAMETDYNTNYTVKMLGSIMDYYNLSKRKLCKEELVQVIILFELEECNREAVENRRRLWKNIRELKNNAYFSKYISFEP